MIDFIKNSYKFEQELDYMEAKKCFNSAMENFPAFVETIQFIFDRCNGRQTEISEKTIDDAFAYIIDKKKSSIYLNETFSHDEKKRMIRQIESYYQMLREYFKSSDFVKARNHNHAKG